MFSALWVFKLEQCELPQAVLDKLSNIEIYSHNPIEAAERTVAGMLSPPKFSAAAHTLPTDCKTVLTMKVRGTYELTNWILDFGPWLKVSTPPELQEEVGSRLMEATGL